MAGTFFAVSTFVMPALARIPLSQGIAAMQSINVVTFYVIDFWAGMPSPCATRANQNHGKGGSRPQIRGHGKGGCGAIEKWLLAVTF
jgi:hypothetical protein